MKNKDALWFGLIVGIVVPFVSYAIILMMYDQLDAMEITSGGSTYRDRTVGLLAIAANIIPINIFKKRYQINNMRGIIIATFIYVIYWVYLYWNLIL